MGRVQTKKKKRKRKREAEWEGIPIGDHQHFGKLVIIKQLLHSISAPAPWACSTGPRAVPVQLDAPKNSISAARYLAKWNGQAYSTGRADLVQ